MLHVAAISTPGAEFVNCRDVRASKRGQGPLLLLLSLLGRGILCNCPVVLLLAALMGYGSYEVAQQAA